MCETFDQDCSSLDEPTVNSQEMTCIQLKQVLFLLARLFNKYINILKLISDVLLCGLQGNYIILRMDHFLPSRYI